MPRRINAPTIAGISIGKCHEPESGKGGPHHRVAQLRRVRWGIVLQTRHPNINITTGVTCHASTRITVEHRERGSADLAHGRGCIPVIAAERGPFRYPRGNEDIAGQGQDHDFGNRKWKKLRRSLSMRSVYGVP